MTQEEYINSLTTEELRYVVNQFWEWYNNDGCPATCYPKYKCHRENTSDCDEEREALEGCWVKYFVWKYREQTEKRKCLN